MKSNSVETQTNTFETNTSNTRTRTSRLYPKKAKNSDNEVKSTQFLGELNKKQKESCVTREIEQDSRRRNCEATSETEFRTNQIEDRKHED